MDEQGWQYSDNAWQGIRPQCTLGSFTRRRCWVRKMKRMLRDVNEVNRTSLDFKKEE